MKKLIVSSLAIIFCIASVTVFAAETNANWIPSVSVRSVVASKYLAFGQGFVNHDKPVVQTDIFAAFDCGFYIDLWNSTPFDGYNKNLGTEQDYGVGWSGKLSKLGIEGLVGELILDIGTSYFDEPSLGTFGANDLMKSYAKISKEFRWLTLNVCYENYTEMPGSSFDGGDLYSFGASKSMSFFNDRLTASTSLALVYDDGGFGFDHGHLLRGSVELYWKLSKRFTLILPQLNYYAPLTLRDSRKLDYVIFGGIAYQF